jgi:gliding motility-associated-like protein
MAAAENSRTTFAEQKTEKAVAEPVFENRSTASASEKNPEGTDGEKTSSEKTSIQKKTENTAQKKEELLENVAPMQSDNEDKQAKPEPSSTPTGASLDATFRFNQTPACVGTAVQFIHENPAVPCTYRWDFGDGKTSSEKSPDHEYKKPGTYTVKLKVTGIKDKITDEKQQTIVVNPKPLVEIDFTPSEYNPSEINFEAKGNNISEYLWDFNDKETSFEKNPVHSYAKTGNYKVTLTVKNSFGCSSTEARLVTIESLFPLAPNSFSPNGDGKNDTWMPASFLHGDYNFTLTIFDRNGKEVFSTSDKNDAWNGANAKTGDVFIWKAIVKHKNGKTGNYNGTITIIE